jgi:hypothetical protein
MLLTPPPRITHPEAPPPTHTHTQTHTPQHAPLTPPSSTPLPFCPLQDLLASVRGGDDSDDDGAAAFVPAPAAKKNRKERTADRHHVVATREGSEEAALRAQLRSLLAQPLLPSFTSLKFITHNPLLNEGVNPGLAHVAGSVLARPTGAGGGQEDSEDEA